MAASASGVAAKSFLPVQARDSRAGGVHEGEKEVSSPTNGPNYDEMTRFEILGGSYCGSICFFLVESSLALPRFAWLGTSMLSC
jgi:hypothetical protein